MNYYAYFIGALGLFILWLILFISNKKLRKEMLWASFMAMPFGLSEIFFVPEYWNPPSLFGLIDKIGFGIESLIFTFAIGGLASIGFEVLKKRRVYRISGDSGFHIAPYVATVLVYIVLEIIFINQSIFNAFAALIIGSIIIAILRKDLVGQIVFSAFFFSFSYVLLFSVFNYIFPEFITDFYSIDNLLGINIFTVPIEEALFAFSIGAFWSTIFEFTRGYRTRLKISR